ncbi:helicase HerA domain-containing protein [Desulforhopalus sp. 52FAK]
MADKYPYEKLGLLYLGRELDLQSGEPSDLPFLYKNKNLTTHGVIIGMTGSGKTGLGIGLIEEAIMDNVPSIVIDPKGDMGNLLLSFPENKPEDFAPWVDSAEAARKDMSVDEFAAVTAKTWKEGLAFWGQGPERIRALRSKTTMTIYTPGSSAGVPISVLSGFLAPDESVLADTDTLNSLVGATTTSLLALVNIDGDPLQSKEHILLSSLLLHFWRKGEDLSIEALIGQIVSPPFTKVGVFSLDTFYPQKDRMSLAMTLNNILASPTFAAWTEGEPLDIQKILYGDNGTPQTAIFSISHLSDAERMFFVTMLLNQFIGWMRRQRGASSLKALLYMDEIFGYFPPTANPPSKKPMMLLLKQARAFGVGVVLSTQNPVDLDYKGLSNIGTWFVGRLQTRQDQEKVVEGIVGASDGNLDAPKVRSLLSDMKGRQFLMNSAHVDEPVLFETRWVMSYLKGPISKNDIKKLMAGGKGAVAPDSNLTEQESAGSGPTARGAGLPPVVSKNIEQLYYMHNVIHEENCLRPRLGLAASVRFFNAKRNIDRVIELNEQLQLDETFSRPDWESSFVPEYTLDDCVTTPPTDSHYYPLPDGFADLKDLKSLTKSFSDYLYQNRRLELFRVTTLGLESDPEEPLVDFKVRLSDHLREKKEEAIEKLESKYRTKQERLEQKLQRAMAKVDKEEQDVQSKTTDSIISFGAAIVGAFFGRKKLSATNIGKAATGIRNVGRVSKEKSDVKRAEQAVQDVQAAIDELAIEIEDKVLELGDNYEVDNFEIETFAIKPRRSDIFDLRVAVVWELVVAQEG